MKRALHAILASVLLGVLLGAAPAWADVSVVTSANLNDGGSATVAAGSNRLFVHAFGWRDPTTLATHTSTAYGVATMTEIVEAADSTAAFQSIEISRLLEAAIPSGSNTLTGTWALTPGSKIGAYIVFAGVDQVTPVATFDSASQTTAGGDLDIDAPSVSVTAGQAVVVACSTFDDITAPAGYTTVRNNAGVHPRYWLGYKLISGAGSEAPACTYTSGRAAIVIAVINPVACTGTPTVTDVDTDETVTQSQANVVWTGTNGCTSGSVTVEQGSNSKTMSEDSHTATTGQVDLSQIGAGTAGGLMYGAANFCVTNTLTNKGCLAITISPPSGTKVVNLPGTGILPLDYDPDYGIPNRPNGYPIDFQSTSQASILNAAGCTLDDLDGAADNGGSNNGTDGDENDVWMRPDASLTIGTSCTSADIDFTHDGLYVGTAAQQLFKGRPARLDRTLPITRRVEVVGTTVVPWDLEGRFISGDTTIASYGFRQATTPVSSGQVTIEDGDLTDIVVLADATPFTKNGWIRIGTGTAFAQVKVVDLPNKTLILYDAVTFAAGDTVYTLTPSDLTLSGLSVNGTSHQVEGKPSASSTNAAAFIRATDSAGVVGSSNPFVWNIKTKAAAARNKQVVNQSN